MRRTFSGLPGDRRTVPVFAAISAHNGRESTVDASAGRVGWVLCTGCEAFIADEFHSRQKTRD